MKNTVLFILIATTAFASDPQTLEPVVQPSSELRSAPLSSELVSTPKPMTLATSLDLSPQRMVSSKDGFFYFRFAAAESDLIHPEPVLPGLGIGYRRLAGDGAADLSVNGIGHAERKSGRIFWTAPKASYIHYLQPNEKQTAYVGGGLAWGGINSRKQNFVGIIPSAMVGYEFVHKGTFLGFSELSFSQPALSVFRTGAFPSPVAEFTTGIGF